MESFAKSALLGKIADDENEKKEDQPRAGYGANDGCSIDIIDVFYVGKRAGESFYG